MKKSKFTDAQIAFVLRQAEEGTSVSEVCRKARGDLLQLAQKIWWVDAFRDEAFKTT